MADLERRVENLENKFPTLEQRVDNVITKMDMFIEESRAMRDRRDAEMREFRERHDNDMREFRAKHDNDMREMRQEMRTLQTNIDSKIDGMGKHVRNISIAVIIGIAAMVVAVLLK